MSHPDVREVLAQADLLFLVARVVSRPGVDHPDESDLKELAAAAGAPDGRLLEEVLLAWRRETRLVSPAAWTGEHTRLFDGAVVCPVNETAYVRRDKGVIIADLCGFYRAFGFEPIEASGEKPDHLACELEFAAVLLVMLAQALRRNDEDASRVTRDALRSFMVDHVAEWLVPFCDHLAATTTLSVYEAAAVLLRVVWAAIVTTLDLPESAPAGVAPEEDGGETPYECGMVEAEQRVTLTGPPGSGLPRHDHPEGERAHA